MGVLLYNGAVGIQVDDRALRHLQVVIEAKLRNRQSFPLQWSDDVAGLTGWGSAWIAPGIPLSFVYEGEPGPLDRGWLERLAAAANGPGLRVIPEEADTVREAGG